MESKKKKYQKPDVQVDEMTFTQSLLAGSPQEPGPGGANESKGDWDSESESVGGSKSLWDNPTDK